MARVPQVANLEHRSHGRGLHVAARIELVGASRTPGDRQAPARRLGKCLRAAHHAPERQPRRRGRCRREAATRSALATSLLLVQRGSQLGAAETPRRATSSSAGGHGPRRHRELRANHRPPGCKRLEPESDSPAQLVRVSSGLAPSRESERRRRRAPAALRFCIVADWALSIRLPLSAPSSSRADATLQA
jgi:hypothetical protein